MQVTNSVHLYSVNGSRKVEQVCSPLTVLDEQPLPVWQREPPTASRPCNRERWKPWKRGQPPFAESSVRCEPAFQANKRQQTVLECARRKG